VFGAESLQFETVDVGDTSSATLSIRNPGSDTLFVNGIVGDPAQPGRFLVDPSLFAVAPGDSLDVVLSFVPDGPGSFSVFLVFEANVGLGDDMPVVPGVSVIGVGRGPDIAIAPDRLFFTTQDESVSDSCECTRGGSGAEPDDCQPLDSLVHAKNCQRRSRTD
jgi:hypothetical protein